MKEKIINYIETLEAKSLQVDDYFKQRNELYIENQKKDKEIKRLNNIINEFEKWLEVNLTNLEKEKANNTYDKGLKQGMLSTGRLIKNKLQELKGSDKE